MRYLLLILWLLLAPIYWYVSKKYCCSPSPIEQQITSPTTPCAKTGPYSFIFSNEKPKLTDQWGVYKDSLIQSIGKNQKLQITGIYRPEEENKTTFENLGLARAHEIKDALGLDGEKVQIVAEKVDLSNRDCAIDGVKFKLNTVTEKIKEIEDRTLIYFPYNSTNKLADVEVEAYLNDVADRVNKSGERVLLTGHTDDLGTEEYNLVLGKKRAEKISDYLISKGVSKNKIKISSEGEASPIADNKTDRGRAQNRRTELKIIK